MTRAKKIALAAAIVGVLAVVMFLLLRPLSWQSLAMRTEEAIFDARGERLRGHFHPEELRALGISEELAVRAINEVVAPSLDALEPDRANRQFSEVGNQYLMSFTVSGGAREPFTAAVPVTVTEKGYRVLLSDVIGASRVIIKASFGDDNGPAWQQRLTDQSKQLRLIGVRGFWNIDTNAIEEWADYPMPSP